jgi:hypothetical protein
MGALELQTYQEAGLHSLISLAELQLVSRRRPLSQIFAAYAGSILLARVLEVGFLGSLTWSLGSRVCVGMNRPVYKRHRHEMSGYIDIEREKGGTGRSAHMYSPTRQSRELLSLNSKELILSGVL